jgi:CSLREA domain-containing protein
MKNRFTFLGLFIALIAAGVMGHAAYAAPALLTIIVNSTADIPAANPTSGVCETAPGNSICTLRAAIQVANVSPGADTIQLQPGTTYLLTRAGQDDTALNGDLDITGTLTILGAGPTSTRIDGNGGVTGDRVFQILYSLKPVTSSVVISGVAMLNGMPTSFGGGVYNGHKLTLINSAVISNTSAGLNAWGGGIFNDGVLTITHSTISSNTATSNNPYAGGIFNNLGKITMTDSTISGNTTSNEGGGIYNVGSLSTSITLTNSTISGNSAHYGGGIYNNGIVQVINSTFSGNSSTVDGGGIYNMYGTMNLFNTTIANNHANADNIGNGVGGGVLNSTFGSVRFINTIIANNSNVIPTLPLPTYNLDECSGAITSQGFNILNAVNVDCTVAGTFTQADPLLGPLANNGGPTQTHALLSGSPAIDAGSSPNCTDNLGAPILSDQRGRTRPFPPGGRCDIGAFEFFPFSQNLFLPFIHK